MPIHTCVIHFVEKKPDETPASTQLASQPVADSELLENLLEDFTREFNSKPSKAWAFFSNTGDASLAQQAQAILSGNLDLFALSTAITQQWQQILDAQQIFMRNHLCFIHYQHSMSEYLAIAFLPQNQGLSINSRFELGSTYYLDLSQLHMAARINLSEWQNNPESRHYISLLKGKGGKKIVDAFNQLLGCEEINDAPAETRTLLQAFDDYLEDTDSSEEVAREKTQTLVRFANEQSRKGEPVALTELSEVLDEDNPQAFYNHIRNKDYGLSPFVPTDRRTLSQFHRFSGRAEGLSISFEAHLLGSKVEYDAERDTLIIRNPPTQLKDQLKRQS